jgi:filamentous hemagglutinin family protein
MLERKIGKCWSLKLLSSLAIAGTVVIFQHPTFAQVTPDNTLGVEKSIVTSNTNNDSLRLQIEGGAIRGTNLFHSFSDFNITEGQSLYFQNPIDITNIISRVTGGSSSNIAGTLGVSGGTANLFLLNPNGIIFGTNAQLDVKGSFAATTATAIQFGTQGFFSSSAPDSPPLLTVNPSAFLFNQVAAAPIVNRSTTPLGSGGQGLQVPDDKSLLLLGGDINFAGGGVNAAGGQVNLGAVAGIGTVGLSLDENRLRLNFPTTLDRADISLTNGATVNTSGEGGGSINIWGRHVLINSGSQVTASTQGSKSGSGLIVNASESLEVIGFVPLGNVSTLSFGDGKAGDLMIETQRLSIINGAQVVSGTLGNGSAGQLTVNASESVEVAGRDNNTGFSSFLASFTGNAGQAGNLTINTRRLIIRDVGALSAESLNASKVVQPSLIAGNGNNLTINASDSVELMREGFIFTGTQRSGDAGNITINTGRLVVQDGSKIGAQSRGSGNAGNITVQARSITLSNKSQIDAATTVSQGGNITLKVEDTLLLRQGSSISATAGTAQAGGDGGNINFDGKFIVAIPNENSDISANAFTGKGGNIQINSQGIFGIESRSKPTDRNDITASSEQGISGVININQPDNSSLQNSFTQLSPNAIDTNALIANSCIARSTKRQENSFTITGSGALRNSPGDVLISAYTTGDVRSVESTSRTWKKGDPIIEAQGLYRLPNGRSLLSRACN